MTVIAFFVPGQPVPKGSMRAISIPGRRFTQLIDSNKNLKAWQKTVETVAMLHAPKELWTGPVQLNLAFKMRRPKSLPKRGGSYAVKKPDTDKLIRVISDSLSRIVYRDDSQVTRIEAVKHYAGIFESPGVAVEVWKMN